MTEKNKDLDKNILVVDLLKGKEIELGSVGDYDLMRVVCYATHEGINLNKTEFSRDILLNSYKSFEGKPLWLVPDFAGLPTGHGFDFENKKFDIDSRKAVGHIVSAEPCVVNENGDCIFFDKENEYSNIKEMETAEGELRIICELVVYRLYLTEVANMIEMLHKDGKLNFSMEGLMDCDIDDDGIKHCTKINFTGLAIVKNPAFVNSYSLDVAEEEIIGGSMDYEKAYNELKAKYDTLLEKYNALKGSKGDGGKAPADKGGSGGSGGSGGGGGKAGCAEEEVAGINKITELLEQISTLQTEISELKPFKEQVVAAQKEALGKDRHARLEKMGYTEKSETELAEISKEAYAELLEKAIDAKAENTQVDKDVNKQVETSGYMGVDFHNSSLESDKDSLLNLLKGLTK